MQMIEEVNVDDFEISLMDGSLWQVNPGDISVACCWLPTQNVQIKRSGQDRYFQYIMVNKDTEQQIFVNKLR